jgi:hypothetical protein
MIPSVPLMGKCRNSVTSFDGFEQPTTTKNIAMLTQKAKFLMPSTSFLTTADLGVLGGKEALRVWTKVFSAMLSAIRGKK